MDRKSILRRYSRGNPLRAQKEKRFLDWWNSWPKQNLHWKLGQQSANAIWWNSLGLFRDFGLNYIFFRNKTFLFFKIESWICQHLFEKEFRETSQNFNSIKQWIEKMEIKIVWMSWIYWNFVRFHEIPFSNRCWKIQLSILKKKSFISKKNLI